MRKLGLDVGSVRIGVAQSDLSNTIASSTEVIVRKSPEKDADRVVELVKKLLVDTIVVGLPLQLNGTAGKSVQMVYDFVEVLKKKTEIPIVFQDERLTTVSAEKILLEADVRRSKRKEVIDKIAACIILQNYLDKPKKWCIL